MSLLWERQNLVREPALVEVPGDVQPQRAQKERATRYRLRAWTGLPWDQVADRSGSPSANAALLSARRHARRYRLPWPPRRVVELTLGARAYWLYARTRLSWEAVADAEDGGNAENVRGCARNYARKEGLPWPARNMADLVQRMYDEYAAGGGATWEAMASTYGYNQASVARKAASRHAAALGLPWPPQLPAGPGVQAGDVPADGSLQARAQRVQPVLAGDE